MTEEKSKKAARRKKKKKEAPKRKTTQRVQLVKVDDITVPRERLTSVWDPTEEEELVESIKVHGIIEPIKLMKIDDNLVLIDGLHRLQIAEKHKMEEVPAIIKQGTPEDLLIENIIYAVQRGKYDPAELSQVIRILAEQRGWDYRAIATHLGMSTGKVRRYHRISHLEPEILAALRGGQLNVTNAFILTSIEDPEKRKLVAQMAVQWNYTIDQMRIAVRSVLDEKYQAEQGEYKILPTGEPQRIPILCFMCGKEIPPPQRYVWLHPQCRDELAQAIQIGLRQEPIEQEQEIPPPPPGWTPETT